MNTKHWTVEEEIILEFKKGQLVKLSAHGLYEYPYNKNQIGIVIKTQPEPQSYRGRTGVWVWLQEDECEVLIDAWDLEVVEKQDAKKKS